jgi:hypothetical protein
MLMFVNGVVFSLMLLNFCAVKKLEKKVNQVLEHLNSVTYNYDESGYDADEESNNDDTEVEENEEVSDEKKYEDVEDILDRCNKINKEDNEKLIDNLSKYTYTELKKRAGMTNNKLTKAELILHLLAN